MRQAEVAPDGGRSLETGIRGRGAGCVVGIRVRRNARRGGRNAVMASEFLVGRARVAGWLICPGMGGTSLRGVRRRIGLGIGCPVGGSSRGDNDRVSFLLLGITPTDARRTVPHLHGPTTLKHFRIHHQLTTIDDTTPPRHVDRRFPALRFPTGKTSMRPVL